MVIIRLYLEYLQDCLPCIFSKIEYYFTFGIVFKSLSHIQSRIIPNKIDYSRNVVFDRCLRHIPVAIFMIYIGIFPYLSFEHFDRGFGICAKLLRTSTLVSPIVYLPSRILTTLGDPTKCKLMPCSTCFKLVFTG